MIEVLNYELTDKLKLKDYIVEKDHLNFDGYKILKYYKYKQKGANDDEV